MTNDGMGLFSAFLKKNYPDKRYMMEVKNEGDFDYANMTIKTLYDGDYNINMLLLKNWHAIGKIGI